LFFVGFLKIYYKENEDGVFKGKINLMMRSDERKL
jgi:hypothetical protein